MCAATRTGTNADAKQVQVRMKTGLCSGPTSLTLSKALGENCVDSAHLAYIKFSMPEPATTDKKARDLGCPL